MYISSITNSKDKGSVNQFEFHPRPMNFNRIPDSSIYRNSCSNSNIEYVTTVLVSSSTDKM